MSCRYVEEICADILREVEERRISIRGAIEDRAHDSTVRRLRSLILALCLDVVRRYVLLEKIFEHSVGEVPRDIFKRNLARIVTYEVRYRDIRIERLVKICRKHGLKASRRDLARMRETSESELVKDLSYEERLHVLYSVPLWLVRYILRKFIDGEQIIRSFSERLPTYVRCRVSRNVVLKKLKELGIDAKEDPDLDDAVIVDKVKLSLIERTLGNLIYVQDKSSMLIAHIVEKLVDNNVRVVDMCSAPGGKAIHITDRIERAYVTGIDISFRRVLTELSLIYRYDAHSKVDVVCASALRPPLRQYSPHIVIVDPDCTSIGKLSHSPEIRLWLREHHVREMARLQYKILRKACSISGRIIMIYSTCTITFEENEDNIKRICDEHGLELVDLCTLFPKFCNIYMRGSLRLFPHTHRTGGYFIACLRS
ncbi:MAG: hypothetical protein GXO23_01400 [Crenarchaeota archaeon]|nr:hypothetical protein [Thermoproteota archaeon]